MTVAVFMGAFPVLPGKDDEARKFARETMEDRREEFNASQKRLNTTKEEWALQQALWVPWCWCDSSARTRKPPSRNSVNRKIPLTSGHASASWRSRGST